jgi:membrane-bound lytic murein transglycosylase A
MIGRALRAASALLAGLMIMAGPGSASDLPARMLAFTDLDGWAEDDHSAALATFQASCATIADKKPDDDWPALCAISEEVTDARAFFERFFLPVLIGNAADALFTGYYEPELPASPVRTARHTVPLYAAPPDLRTGPRPYASRAEIETQGLLEGRGLEIAWVEDPVEKFFLQVQGSGSLRMTDGGIVWVGFGGKNGHEYRSIGRELVRRGLFEAHQVSAAVIKRWVSANPAEGRALLNHNPSYVFFRRIEDLPPELGPLGAIQVPLTAGRSIAVDPEFVPLGAPVWLEKGGAAPLHRLMVAQDTGSAIKGMQRGDVFYGSGAAAGRVAGRTRDGGRMIVLLPIEAAYRLAPGY